MTRATPLESVPLAQTRGRARSMFVRNLEVECSIGIHRHERGARQHVRVDIELTVRDDAPVDDNIANVISYDDIVAGVKAVATTGHINLVETLADRIADFCMADRRVTKARVRVEKRGAVAGAAGVGVEVERVSDPT